MIKFIKCSWYVIACIQLKKLNKTNQMHPVGRVPVIPLFCWYIWKYVDIKRVQDLRGVVSRQHNTRTHVYGCQSGIVKRVTKKSKAFAFYACLVFIRNHADLFHEYVILFYNFSTGINDDLNDTVQMTFGRPVENIVSENNHILNDL